MSHKSPELCDAPAGKRHGLPWKTSAALDAQKTDLDKLTLPDIGFRMFGLSIFQACGQITNKNGTCP